MVRTGQAPTTKNHDANGYRTVAYAGTDLLDRLYRSGGNSEPSDPLRFDMYAQRLGNVLLPGITNKTERLRYLSMVCAGIAATTQSAGEPLARAAPRVSSVRARLGARNDRQR